MSAAVTTTFSANTRIKSAEVNQNFVDCFPVVQAWTVTSFNSDNSTASSVNFDADDCRYIRHGKFVECWIFMNYTSNPGFNAYLVPPVTPETSGKTAGNNITLGMGEFQNASPGLMVFFALAQASARINIHLSTATQFGTTAFGGHFSYPAA